MKFCNSDQLCYDIVNLKNLKMQCLLNDETLLQNALIRLTEEFYVIV